MSTETEDNPAATPCPGARLGLAFNNLTSGESYTITLCGGLSFTHASSGTDALPGGVTFAGAQAKFTAPSGETVTGMVDVSFVLGVVVSSVEVCVSADLKGSEKLSVSLLGGGASGQGELTFKALESELPPTCVVLNPNVPSCPVCAMDTSKCPEAAAISESLFCMGQHIFLCCLECPGSPALAPD
jgi:hypothetical protein